MLLQQPTPMMRQFLFDNLLQNRVHHIEALDLLNLLPDESIDLIVTSPPYDNLRKYNGFSFDFEGIARESHRVMKDGAVLVWVIRDSFVNGSETLTSFRQALYFCECGLNMHQRIVWQKEGLPTKRPKAYLPDFEDVFVFSKGEPSTFNPTLRRNKKAGQVNRKGRAGINGFAYNDGLRQVAEMSLLTNVWTIGVGRGKTTSDAVDHPAMFPEQLAERCITSWSDPGHIVLDYFGGSGTTAKMARNNQRRFITGDISAEYCDQMNQRLDQPYMLPMFAAVGGD